MKLSNKQVIIVLLVIVGTGLGLKIHQTYFPPSPPVNQLIINDQVITVELANTPEKQILGLSNRNNLAPHTGMLFVFSDSIVRNFWMKDMLIPIDIIWIKDNKIVGIEKDAPVPTSTEEIPIFNSQVPVNLVLEVNAGYTDQYNIKIGDNITFNVKR